MAATRPQIPIVLKHNSVRKSPVANNFMLLFVLAGHHQIQVHPEAKPSKEPMILTDVP